MAANGPHHLGSSRSRHEPVADDRFDYGEVGRISAGFLDGRMVVIVWTERGTSRHIVSMRYCHDKEEKRWRKILREAGDR